MGFFLLWELVEVAEKYSAFFRSERICEVVWKVHGHRVEGQRGREEGVTPARTTARKTCDVIVC